MAAKEKQKVVHKRVVVKKHSSPYAPMMKLIYRTCIGLAIIVVVWMAYEMFNTARVGMKAYSQQEQDYQRAIGASASKAKQPSQKPEQQKSAEDKAKDDGADN